MMPLNNKCYQVPSDVYNTFEQSYFRMARGLGARRAYYGKVCIFISAA